MFHSARSLLEKPILQLALATYFLLAAGGCSEPVKTGPSASESASEVPTVSAAPAPPAAPTKTSAESNTTIQPKPKGSGLDSATLDSAKSLSPSSVPLAPRPKPQEPPVPVINPVPDSVIPEVRLLLEDKSITLRGQLNSEFLIRDIVSRLSELNGYTIDNQIVYHQSVQGAQWANNLANVLPPLVEQVPDLKLRVKDDTITLIGNVAKAGEIKKIAEAVIENMEGTEIATMDNQLKAGP